MNRGLRLLRARLLQALVILRCGSKIEDRLQKLAVLGKFFWNFFHALGQKIVVLSRNLPAFRNRVSPARR